MSKTALVLCSPRIQLAEQFPKQGFNATFGELAISTAFSKAGFFLGPRPMLDAKPLDATPRQFDNAVDGYPIFRQVLPYIVLRCGEKILCYSRGGAGQEARLHGAISFGFGGHIDAEDIKWADSVPKFIETISLNAAREVEEETGICSENYNSNIISKEWVGVILDDSNPVGRDHVAVVGVWDLEEIPEEFSAEDCIEAAFPATMAELAELRPRMESWTAILFDHFFAKTA